MGNPEISVIIPVKNGGAVFEECLSAVSASQGANYEVVILDDGSTDNSSEIARRYSSCLIQLPSSSGPSHARNKGAEAARGNVLFFIDADILVRPDTLAKICSIFQDKGVIAVTGVLTDYIRYKNFCSQLKNLWMRYTYLRMPEEVSLFYTSGAAIRREVFLESGGFDTGYRSPSVEDTDFGQKLESMGYKVRLRKEVELEHVKYYSLFGLLKTDFYRSAALFKMTLRNGLLRLLRGKNKTSVPSSYILGIILFLVSLLAILIGAASSSVRIFSFLPISTFILVFFLLNRPFLNWLNSRRGYWFSMKTFLFMFLELPLMIMGIIFGAVDYLRGNRY